MHPRLDAQLLRPLGWPVCSHAVHERTNCFGREPTDGQAPSVGYAGGQVRRISERQNRVWPKSAHVTVGVDVRLLDD